MLIVLAVGVFADVIVNNEDYPFFHIFPTFTIKDYGAICNTLIAAQATVITLAIAMLALISSRISKNYMGISICEYILNEKQIYFKYDKIFISELSILIFSIFLNFYELYNTAISFLIISLILINISFYLIYNAFIKDYKIKEKINKHLIRNLRKFKNKKILVYIKKFIEEWVNVFEQQTNHEYNKYNKNFERINSTVFKRFNKEEYKELEGNLKMFFTNLLLSYSNEIKEKVLIIFFNTYKTLYNKLDLTYINNKKNKENIKDKLDCNFHLFLEIYDIFLKNVELLKKENIEKIKNIKWNYFCYYVIIINFKFKNNKSKKELFYLRWLYQNLGCWASQDTDEGDSVWKNIIKDYQDLSREDDNEGEDPFLTEYRSICFAYSASLIINGRADFIENILNLDLIKDSYYNKNYKNFFIYTFLIKSFIFYIIKRKKDLEKINSNLNRVIDDFIKKDSTRKFFEYILDVISNEYITIINIELVEIIETEILIQEYYLFPIIEKYEFINKNVIVYDIVRDFIIFTVLYLQMKSCNNENLIYNFFIKDIGNDYIKIKKYCSYYVQENKDNLVKLISEYLDMLTFSDKENNREKNIFLYANEMYNILKEASYKIIKELYIKESEEKYNSSENLSIKEKEKKYKDLISNYFKEKYKNIILINIDNNKALLEKFIIKLNYKISYYIDFENTFDLLDKIYYNKINEMIIYYICCLLVDNKSITKYKTTEFLKYFENVSDFTKYKNADYLGSNFPFQPTCSENIYEFFKWKKLQEDLEIRMITNDVHYGLLLVKDALKIVIQDVVVNDRPQTIEDKKIEPDPETGKYKFEVDPGIRLDLTRDELEKYLSNTERVMEIMIKVYCPVETGTKIGFLIER